MTKRIQELIAESVEFPQDSQRDNELVALLKIEDTSVALEIIKDMARRRSPNTLHVAGRVLTYRKVAEPFFLFALENVDASSIRLLLEFALPRIGLRTTILCLKSREVEDPEILDKALYWLPNLVKEKDLNIIEELRKTREITD